MYWFLLYYLSTSFLILAHIS